VIGVRHGAGVAFRVQQLGGGHTLLLGGSAMHEGVLRAGAQDERLLHRELDLVLDLVVLGWFG